MEKRSEIYIWVIAILAVTNIATIGSIYYHLNSEKNTSTEQKYEVPSEQRTRFLTEQLSLTGDQTEQFRNINRTFNRTANPITNQLDDLRIEMLEELSANESNKKKLDDIAQEIGNLHTSLKKATIDFYLQMKSICTEEQQTKMYQIFHSMLNQEEDVKLPRGRHQEGRGRNNYSN